MTVFPNTVNLLSCLLCVHCFEIKNMNVLVCVFELKTHCFLVKQFIF